VLKRNREVALDEWRDLNEAEVFGAGFQEFLADLALVEDLDLAAFALPEGDAAAAPEPAVEQ